MEFSEGVEFKPRVWILLGLGIVAFVLAFNVAPAHAWTVSLSPDSRQADTATGYGITLLANDADRPVTSVDFTLPDGVGMSASLGNRLAICTADQFRATDTDQAPACPSDSNIADVAMDLPPRGAGPKLVGNAYLGQPQLGTSRGDVYPLQVAAQFGGQWAKLVGEVVLNQIGKPDGVVSAHFPMPGIPLSQINFKFRDGDAAALINPATCGDHSGSAALTDVDGNVHGLLTGVAITAGFNGSACDSRAFAPSVSLQQSTTSAGKDVALRVSLGRVDGEQHIAGMHVEMPSGLSIDPAKTKSCPSEVALSGRCASDLAVGQVSTTVGSGTAALKLTGSVFFTLDPKLGPTMVFAIPAKVGPLDLGTVVIPAPVTFGTSTRGMSVDSQLPQYFRGIPLLLRHLDLEINAPGMLQNPRDCGGAGLRASFTSTEGAMGRAEAPVSITGGPTCDFIHTVVVAPKQFAPVHAQLARRKGKRKPPRGGVLAYTLKTPATVKQVIQRGTSRKLVRRGGRIRCSGKMTWKTLVASSSSSAAGVHKTRLTGMRKGRPMPVGCYRAVLSATAGSKRSQIHQANFSIIN